MEPSFPPPPYSECALDQKPLQEAYHYRYPGISSFPPPTTVHGQSAPMQPSQQQQQVIVVANPTTVAPNVVYNPYPVPMAGALILSCIVFWCFGWLIGGIAFILAVLGSSSSASGDVAGAIRLRNASYGMSVVGIVVGIVVLALIVSFYSSCSASNPYRKLNCH